MIIHYNVLGSDLNFWKMAKCYGKFSIFRFKLFSWKFLRNV